VNVRRGNEVMLERDNADKLVSAVGAQSMYVLIAGAGHEDAEFVPPAITATVAASTSAAVLANGNPRSGRIGVTGFTEDQRSISVAFRTRPKAPERPHTVAQTPERTKPAADGGGRAGCCPRADRLPRRVPAGSMGQIQDPPQTIRYTDPDNRL
jgi:hypothetical protein